MYNFIIATTTYLTFDSKNSEQIIGNLQDFYFHVISFMAIGA